MDYAFPLFRKHAAGKSFFIIQNENEYQEFQWVGKQLFSYNFKINNYFDSLHLKSLLDAEYPILIAEKQEIDKLINML
ncbi:MAG: hypothetical protein K9I25_01330 [Crocinitomicaceae bacterium]|jgi:hypothetical protein|nr:hypothetical protein [Crocinitomicaceae bacterium]